MIKNLRKSRNLIQEQLGVLSGMTKSQISRMEKGTLGSPETVERLLTAMGYSIEMKVVDKYESEGGERQRVLKQTISDISTTLNLVEQNKSLKK